MFKRKQAARLGTYVVITLSCLLPIAHAQSGAKEVIKPENEELTLHGMVRLVHAYGPPGFGEDPRHDSHVVYWALETRAPINTACVPEKPEWAKYDCRSARRMKLFFPGSEVTTFNHLPAARWRDQSVVLTGKLRRADTAGEMTPIYIDVTSINAAPIQKAHQE